MSLLRIIGYLGIALLTLLAAFGLFISITNEDWRGVVLMVGFALLPAFFAYSLRSAARRQPSPDAQAMSDSGWMDQPLSALFRGPILHTPEGLIVVCGSLALLVFAVLSFLVPSWIGLSPERSAVDAMTFGLWPILLFVMYVRLCEPHFHAGVFSTLLVLGTAAFPFYMAYK